MHAWRASALALLVAFTLPASARAQRTQLTVSGYPIAFAAPTAADFNAGQITSTGALLFTVDATSGTTGQRTTYVYIRCAAPCPVSGSKPLSSLKWRRSDLSTWNVLSTTDALVESRVQFKGGTNDPWTNSVYFQFALGWLTDPPNATANSYNIVLTLTVTVP